MSTTSVPSATKTNSYEQVVRQIWQAPPSHPIGKLAIQQELVRCATLAASSHNTQCWQFKIEDQLITILPDLERRCPSVDPDNHHLYASLGCATENLVQAAKAYGFACQVEIDEANGIKVHLKIAPPIISPLFKGIPLRQSTRTEYDGQPLSHAELQQLETAAAGDGIQLILVTDKQAMEEIAEYIVAGNTTQMNDPMFVQELKSWIRFSEQEAVCTGDGLFSKCTGNPTAPRWLGRRLFDVLVKSKAENKKCLQQIRSSAGLAIFVSEANTPAHWIAAGRSYQRFALQAAVLDIRTAFLNQPVEVASLRPQFARYLNIGDRRPDLVVRFGHGVTMPRSLRRPLADVLV